MNAPLKQCSRCREMKDAAGFSRSAREPDGLHRWCKDCRRAADREYCERNAAVRRQRAARWNREHAERVNANAAQRLARARAAGIPPRVRNAFLNQIHQLNFRARSLGAAEAVSKDDVLLVLHCYGAQCLVCQGSERLALDHVVPIARGGRNHASNLQPLCKSCNSSKRQQTTDHRPSELRRWLVRELAGET